MSVQEPRLDTPGDAWVRSSPEERLKEFLEWHARLRERPPGSRGEADRPPGDADHRGHRPSGRWAAVPTWDG